MTRKLSLNSKHYLYFKDTVIHSIERGNLSFFYVSQGYRENKVA